MAQLFTVLRIETISYEYHIVAETPEQAVQIGAVLPRCFAAKTVKEAATTVVVEEETERKELSNMLTGKNIVDALVDVDSSSLSWESHTTYERTMYDMAASALNGQYLAPLQKKIEALQQLVREYQATNLHSTATVDFDLWYGRKAALDERARVLLAGEVKA